MLASASTETRFATPDAEGDVGTACGGSVKFDFEPASGRRALADRDLPGPATSPRRCCRSCFPSPAPSSAATPGPTGWRSCPARPTCAPSRWRSRPAWFTSCRQRFRPLHDPGPPDRPPDPPARAGRPGGFSFPLRVIGSDSKAAIPPRRGAGRRPDSQPERAERFHCPLGLDFRCEPSTKKDRAQHRRAAPDGAGSAAGEEAGPIRQTLGAASDCPRPWQARPAAHGAGFAVGRKRHRGSPRATEIASMSSGSPTALLPWMVRSWAALGSSVTLNSIGASLIAGIW